VIARGDIRWFRFASPDKRAYLGPLIAQLPDERLPAVRAALIDVLGLD
jgi:hypothetical protein